MSVYNNLIVRTNMPLSDSIGGLKLSILDFMCILIEGHNGILQYSLTEITIRLKKGNLIISGNGLTIYEINADEIIIKGNMSAIRREI